MAIYDRPTSWDGTPMSFGQKNTITFQIVGVPSTPYQFQQSVDGVNWDNADLISLAGNSTTNGLVSLNGFYYPPGNLWYQYTAGAGSTVLISASSAST